MPNDWYSHFSGLHEILFSKNQPVPVYDLLAIQFDTVLHSISTTNYNYKLQLQTTSRFNAITIDIHDIKNVSVLLAWSRYVRELSRRVRNYNYNCNCATAAASAMFCDAESVFTACDVFY